MLEDDAGRAGSQLQTSCTTVKVLSNNNIYISFYLTSDAVLLRVHVDEEPIYTIQKPSSVGAKSLYFISSYLPRIH